MGARHAPDARVRRCAGCGLVYLSPFPTPEALAEYYAGAYIEEYEGEVSPERTYANGVLEARARVSRLTPQLNRTMRVLEVGASCGTFLEAVRPFVKDVVGVEPGEQHRAWATDVLGLKMTTDLAGAEGRFDLIALFHTLEHLLDPVAFVRRLREKLSDGGRLVIEVPNVDDALLCLYNIPAFRPFYFQRAHLYYFSSTTLANVITAAGGHAEVIGIQRYDLSNHLRWLQTGEPGGDGSYSNVFSPALNSAYAESLIRTGMADTLWAICTF